MNNIKILFIITKSSVGGAQKFVSQQLNLLNEEGCKLYLATEEEGNLYINNKNMLEDSFLDKRIEKFTSVSYILDLKNFIQKNNIDLVVCNSANGGLYGRIAAFLAKKKSIYVSHGWSSVYNGAKISFILNKIETFLSLLGNKVLCNSEYDAYIAKNVIKVAPNKIVMIHNCIFPQDEIKIRKHKDHYNILFLGRLTHPKKPELLIKAVKNIQNVTLYIVGSGKNDSYYYDLITNEDVKNVKMIGEIKNFNDFNKYDIFSLISLSEANPISALEAMSSGMPLVLSNIKGCFSLIQNNGVLTENNPEAIEESIIKVIENIEEYSKNSIKIFNENYNLDINKNKYLDLYKSLM